MSLETLVLALLMALATYRLARLLTLELGPGDVLLKLRIWAGVYDYGPNGEPQSSLGKAFSCPHCIGMWLALAVTLAGYGWQRNWWLVWLAVAGIQSWMWSVRPQH